MTSGYPELVAAISSEITRNGPIPFVRFMELALYHPQYGYYMRRSDCVERERIGWSGDFYTSSDVHPILGYAIAGQARQMDEVLGCPTPFTIVAGTILAQAVFVPSAYAIAWIANYV